MKGLPRAIIKKYGVTKKAWQVYRSGKTPTKKFIRVKSRTLSGTKMARRYRRAKTRRRRKGFTIPLAPIAGLAAGLFQPATLAMKGDYFQAGRTLTLAYTGYDIQYNKWAPWDMIKGVAPLVAGLLVHKFVGGNLGVNRMLASANVPIIRI